MNKILVTAIITTHNRVDLLKGAINSVLSQTYKNIECIVVDDASSDGTSEYCKSLNCIRYISISKENSRGGNYARNIGIQNARGEYVAFLDDDDEWYPEKIEKQILVIEKNTDVGVVYCGRMIKEITTSGVSYIKDLPRIGARGDMHIKILSRIYFVTSECMIRKQLLLDVGCFDENVKFWQEYELMIRLLQVTKVDFVNECLITYRASLIDSQRLTNNYINWLEAVRQIESKHADLYKSLPLYHKLKHRIRLLSESTARILKSNDKNLIKKNILRVVVYYLSIYPIKIIRKLNAKI